MSTPKRYFWLKFKDTFFQQKEIKKLRTIAGGATYTIIYLKMQLLSVKNEGVLKFDKTEKDLAEQLSIELDEKYDDVVLVIAYMQKHNLIESISDDEFLLPNVPPLIGSEGDSAERVRKLRSRKALQCNKPVTKCNTELELEKKIEIEKEKKVNVLKHVALTRTEYDSLIRDYSQEVTDDYINNLNDYIGSKGIKYKSHYHTIRSWYRKDHTKK